MDPKGLISFRIDWLDVLAGQGTLKSLPQHHSSKASIPQPSAFFIDQLSHPYMLLLSHLSRVRLHVTPQMAAHQAPQALGFPRQEHWSGLPFPSPMHESEKWKWSRSVVSNPQQSHGLQPSRLLCPWDFPGKSTGVGCHWLLWSVHDYWKNHSFDYMDLGLQNNVSVFPSMLLYLSNSPDR